jgi:3-phenylpropionate/trans-cinnamate dioxygenase ferredoxin subunit
MNAQRYEVCPATDLPPGARKVVEAGGRSIGVFNLNGQLYALKNLCPHKAAPLCAGPLTGLVTGDLPGALTLERAGEVVRCPWHGWEFDIRTGRSVFSPDRVRTKTYPACFEKSPAAREACSRGAVETYAVEVEAQQVVVYL